jgi:hypothetical protein
LEENEQQQSEIIDINEIPSPEMILINSTLILEEIQQPEAEAMKVDTPAAAQQHQNPGRGNPKGSATRKHRSSPGS